MELIILTGMSGAGKSIVANTLDDLGFYCVDNMPAVMLSEFIRVYEQIPDRNPKVAFVIDIRGENEFNTLSRQLDAISGGEKRHRMIFLDCEDWEIINRYKKTRRIHPLTAMKGVHLNDAIATERALLSDVRERADYCVDTTKLSDQQLRDRVSQIITNALESGIVVTCLSFGFKFGVPSESDMVFDVRMFPNPYYIEEFRELTGLDPNVSAYILSHEVTTDFIARMNAFVDSLIPLFVKDGRTQAIISIGCTGGKHRSVCIAERLREHLSAGGTRAITMHRDILK